MRTLLISSAHVRISPGCIIGSFFFLLFSIETAACDELVMKDADEDYGDNSATAETSGRLYEAFAS